jgi:Fe-S oxidoreductase
MVTSPHCFLSFRGDYRELGADFEVLHQTQLLQRLIVDGRLEPKRPLGRRVVYHDPCTLGRQSGIFDEPRELLRSIPDLELVEFPTYNRELSLCCGGGSGGVWLERPRDERLAELRVRQAIETGAEILAVACPYCLQMFEDAVRTMELSLEVRDVAELLADSL